MSWSLIGFLAANFFAALSGGLFAPDGWFKALKKPRWQPPDWAFPVVWTVLYALNGIAGWMVYGAVGLDPLIFGVYFLSLVFNAAWSALFFGMHRMDLALWDAALLWASVALQCVLFFSVDFWAGAMILPYLAWVTVAFALNRTVWRMNPDASGKSEGEVAS
ncbi:MAG: TspO/MBR family protein [Pseudomonadota bacterium]